MKPALLLHNDVGSAMETAPAGFLRRLWWVLLLCTLVVPAHAGEISIAPDPIPATVLCPLAALSNRQYFHLLRDGGGPGQVVW